MYHSEDFSYAYPRENDVSITDTDLRHGEHFVTPSIAYTSSIYSDRKIINDFTRFS